GQGSSGSGMAFGLVATGSLRYALDDKMFIGAALHYKNCAVATGSDTADGGYKGLFVNFGMFF
ncbi:MAG: hypothetical protein GY866_09270, partial [Proteobacteria bacterium]|nr:hypothetical protein [Pseudomonadota bacterium]